MRLVSYAAGGDLRPGVVFDGRVFDVGELLGNGGSGPAAPTMRGLLEECGGDLRALAGRLADAAGADGGRGVGAAADLTLGPPVPDAGKVLCIGLNYAPHVAETKRELPKHPDVFSKFASSLTGPTDDLSISRVSDKLDYEGELAVVIGRPCRDVSEADALDRVAGAMILNDISARDLQFNGTQWLPGKAVDGSTPCGPALVTLDEVGDPEDLELVTRVNGEEVQRSHTDRLIFSIPRIIAYVSHFLELLPGDVISTGTPEGIGSRREPPRFLAPGDVVEVAIDHLGSLRNVIR